MVMLRIPQMADGDRDSPSWVLPDEIASPYRPAGFIRRAIATLIDTAVIGMLFQFFMVSNL